MQYHAGRERSKKYKTRFNACWFGEEYPKATYNSVWQKQHQIYHPTEEAFAEYVAKCKELALYDTGVSAEYGDKLITLSTCEYSAQNGRLVVVAKKVV